MNRWLKGNNGEKILLSGVLIARKFDKQEEAFFIKLATMVDDGLIENIKIGVAVVARSGAQTAPARTITCFHSTIPRTNFTAFYRRLSTSQIILIGVGEHTGGTNKKYSVQWADGTSVTIDLDQKSTGVDFLSDPKRLNEQGNHV